MLAVSIRAVILLPLFIQCFAQDDTKTVNLLEIEKYKWEGFDTGNTTINVTAENYTISVNIEICNIGIPGKEPNTEYLCLKNGDENPISQDNGRIFAYIKKPKKLFFFSSNVSLQLRTSRKLTQKCTVTFEKADPEDPTLPPVTTTESIITYGPEISKYSTVFISGHSIEQFNDDKKIMQELKKIIVAMADEYTTLEGFCLMKKIESKDVHIYTLEQCSTQWPDFNNCVRLVYSLPVKIKSSCSQWQGYQITGEHLDLMWMRLASKYLKGNFSVYKEPEIDSLVTWWVIGVVLVIILLATTLVLVNWLWRRKHAFERSHLLDDSNQPSDTRKISEMCLTPPYFQPIPPMFGKTDNVDEINGIDNEGFRYNTVSNEDNGTTI